MLLTAAVSPGPVFAIPTLKSPMFAPPMFALPMLPKPTFELPRFALPRFALPTLNWPRFARPALKVDPFGPRSTPVRSAPTLESPERLAGVAKSAALVL
ncbi:Uncharacterised protein [Mycobacterium tuberculosis]|uniref:Exported repetitive protein PirG n=1 Tax=Mycobacterium tuberculosis TaxID=1773 RepID=A0A655JGS9_MYCTX|nr:Uncharacterised protein [Mycobacterium tuberculosis]CFG74423.1 Uncharacterised protein [Mycobacterium tuberculosis]CKN27978.1 Uncharacterised protein [Mycobacterium tuberculosis]CKO92829.1 Uncharacterised protein [Mycobacterium tuberculosis]CKR34720.1 Uncharacterised protein [Mycobacterium tuberculosis]